WHWSEATHTTGLAPTQVLPWQVSVRVHALPSSQPLPSGLLWLLQVPVAGSQEAGVWSWSPQHTTGSAPTQMPRWQVSVRVQALPSLQEAPSGLAGLLQAPVAGLQVPAVWHWSEAAHTTGSVPTHAPATQVSVCV